MSAKSDAVRYRSALALVIVLSIALRFIGLFWGVPAASHPGHSYHQDEMFHISWGLTLYEGDYIAQHFMYGGTLYFSFMAAVYKLSEVFSGLLHNIGPLVDAIETGRVVCATISVATVALVASLGRRLAGPAVGLLAAAMLALSPGHVFLAKLVRPDQVATFLVTLLMWLAARAMEPAASPRARTRRYAVMGLLLGAMVAFRFPLALFGVAPLTTLWLEWRATPAPRANPLRDRALWLLVVLTPVGFALASPHSVLHPGWQLAGLKLQFNFQTDVFAEALGRGPGLYQYGVRMPVEALGMPMYAMALTGVVYGAWRRRPAQLLLLVSMLPYFLLTSRATWVVVRYVLPMLPMLSVLAGIAIVDAARAAGRLRFALGAVVAAAGAITLLADAALLGVVARPDVRDVVTAWLARAVPAGTGVLEFERYRGDNCFNPPLPSNVDARWFALEAVSDPRTIADDRAAQVVIVHEDITREAERLGASDPRPEYRALLALLAPDGAFREAARFAPPVTVFGLHFDRWFQSADYYVMRPEIRVYVRKR